MDEYLVRRLVRDAMALHYSSLHKELLERKHYCLLPSEHLHVVFDTVNETYTFYSEQYPLLHVRKYQDDELCFYWTELRRPPHSMEVHYLE